MESNQPSAKVKLYIFVERGHMSDPSQKVKLRRGREGMEEKAERLALFFKTTWTFPWQDASDERYVLLRELHPGEVTTGRP